MHTPHTPWGQQSQRERFQFVFSRSLRCGRHSRSCYLEALVVNGHLAADAELNLERVHADEVPGVEECLVLVGGSHEPIVRILSR